LNQSGGYNPRNYYVTNNANTFTNITAYLLLSTSGYFVRFHVLTITNQPIANAFGIAQLFINNQWTTVEQEYSDSSGTATFFLNPTSTYQMNFTASGYSSSQFTITPTQQDYNVQLSSSGGNVSGINIAAYYWSVRNAGGIYENSTLIPINFTYIDYLGITTDFGMNITDPAGNKIFTQDNTGQSGSIIVSVNTTGTARLGTITMVAWANRNTGQLLQQYYYLVIGSNTTAGNNFVNLPTFSNIGTATSEAGVSHPITDIVALFIITLAIAASSRLPWHYMGASIVGLIVLGIFMFIGWIQLGGVVALNWGIYGVFWLIVISILYLRYGI
jgi:hypothetical protein